VSKSVPLGPSQLQITLYSLKASVGPAQTTVAGWAAELMQVVNGEFVSALAPVSLFGTLFAPGNAIGFDLPQPMKLPSRQAGATVGGSFVGEAQPIPVRRLSLVSTSLTPKKFGVLSTVTEEIASYSVPAIELILRQTITEDSAVALDAILTDGTAASPTRPAGLLNGVTPIPASAATPASEAALADVRALITAVQPATRMAFACNPAQQPALARALLGTGLGIMPSAGIAAGTVLCIDLDAVLFGGNGLPRFAMSSETALHEDDAPTALSTPGSPNVVTAPARSTYQTDAIALRMIWFIDWSKRRSAGVSVVTATTW